MVVRKDFYLLPKLNDILQQAIESGLVQKWKMDSQMYEVKSSESHEQVVLAIEHCLAAVILLCIGLLFAGLSLVAEIFTNFSIRSNFNKWMRPFWCTIERCFFIPERSFFIDK